ncbi:hypothetical protein Dsin_025200 [Dipteronia sinensis]|uniref:Helicase ATP-binding domain-containing protein n=1 Tax=Dipteronia sinensis TaxID=43782 RepID=A0AAE0DWK1_9ROSI|nr:hypothetical protein Dsin_025200 [Dipteronia sinensis]
MLEFSAKTILVHGGIEARPRCQRSLPFGDAYGTGKTIALLSLITSYALSKPLNSVKLINCASTVHEMEKTLAELKLLHNYQTLHLGPAAKILAIGLSSRKSLCVNSMVLAAENRDSVNGLSKTDCQLGSSLGC